MATVSFTREMRLNEEETERLFKILESEPKTTRRITTPPAKEASKELLDKIFGDK
ncbi:MAG: hypothetical protein J6O00_03615 [Clostridiales bacterium]|nr:hypothetical protein [Clostridiales bacterium]